MSGYAVCAAILMIGALPPALFLCSRGTSAERLIGLELLTGVTVVLLLLIPQVVDLSYELIVPLVLVPLSAAGTLVFTRLIRRSH